jgi:NAD(P)-dependent dehydrogenase (short-subunit alcohol dehydrogenase family)
MAASQRFFGKSVLITGSSSGMGAEFAKAFAAEGASVSITGRNLQALEKIAAECKQKGGKVVHTAGDLTSDVLRKKLVQNTLSAFGKIDILINNAGMNLARKTILEDNDENFETVLNLNLRSVYHLTSIVAPHIVKTKGNIVNISSVASIKPVIGSAAYAIAKAGIDMMTRCLAAELAPHGVRVNGINPGLFRTDFIRFLTTDKAKRDEVLTNIGTAGALGRVGEVEEIANLVLFLASDQASFITGSNQLCDGGWLLPK